MDTLKNFRKFTDQLPVDEVIMPVLFIGHGSPMNGIEDNEFSAFWEKLPATKGSTCYFGTLAHSRNSNYIDAQSKNHL